MDVEPSVEGRVLNPRLRGARFHIDTFSICQSTRKLLTTRSNYVRALRTHIDWFHVRPVHSDSEDMWIARWLSGAGRVINLSSGRSNWDSGGAWRGPPAGTRVCQSTLHTGALITPRGKTKGLRPPCMCGSCNYSPPRDIGHTPAVAGWILK